MNLELTRHSKAVKAAPKNNDISQTGANDELLPVFRIEPQTWAIDKVLKF